MLSPFPSGRGRPRTPHNIRVEIDGEMVRIPVSAEVYAHWHDQFVRPSATSLQRKRFSTLMNVMRAAFKEGQNRARGQ